MPQGDPGFEWWLGGDEVWKPSMIDAYRANPNLHLLAVSALHRERRADLGCMSWMTPGQRMLLSTTELENHVNQGGFSKLWCYGGWALAPAAEGYRLLGAADVAEVLERTLGVADWTRAGEDDLLTDEQREAMSRLEDEYYERATFRTGTKIHELKNAYIVANPGEFPAAG